MVLNSKMITRVGTGPEKDDCHARTLTRWGWGLTKAPRLCFKVGLGEQV